MENGVIQRKTVNVLYDNGSDNSWCDESLSDYVSIKQAVRFQVDTMLGSGKPQEGETWHMTFELPDGTMRRAALLKSKHSSLVQFLRCKDSS